MGNSQQQRYVTNNDAMEIIGTGRWDSVKSKLEGFGNTGMDFQLFSNILRSRFEKMVFMYRFSIVTYHLTYFFTAKRNM